MRRFANTFDDIVKKLGGVEAVADLTRRSTQAVFNWRMRGRFPTVLWFDITEELERRGYICDARWLFGFEDNRNTRRDAA
jgi:hypothetical protein